MSLRSAFSGYCLSWHAPGVAFRRAINNIQETSTPELYTWHVLRTVLQTKATLERSLKRAAHDHELDSS